MDEKSLYNGESQPLTIEDKYRINTKTIESERNPQINLCRFVKHFGQ